MEDVLNFVERLSCMSISNSEIELSIHELGLIFIRREQVQEAFEAEKVLVELLNDYREFVRCKAYATLKTNIEYIQSDMSRMLLAIYSAIISPTELDRAKAMTK